MKITEITPVKNTTPKSEIPSASPTMGDIPEKKARGALQ